MMSSKSPSSVEQLLTNAHSLQGMALGQLATCLHVNIPTDLVRSKGWIGQLIETALGTSAGNTDWPDFPHLGIELKTIPVDEWGRPKESTYITKITLPIEEQDFWTSRLWRKCQHILWLPIESNPAIPLFKRRIGQAFLWRPSPTIAAQLAADWQTLTAALQRGDGLAVDATWGDILQVRPKAADGQVRVDLVNEQGNNSQLNPKGFYLRSRFTKTILNQYFGLNNG